MEGLVAAVEQLKSEDIADAILYALSTPPRVQVIFFEIIKKVMN